LKQLAQFKNLKAALKIPVLGTMISAGSIGMIMANDELSKEQKISQIAGALGGIGGGLLGTIAGATVGSIVPLLGTGVGGLLGGVLGAMSGDYIASQVAQWLLGEESELIGVAKSLQEASKSGGAVSTAQSVTGTPGGDAIAKGIAKALPTQGGQVAQSTQTLNELLSGNSGSALFAPTSNTSNVSNNTSLVSSSLNSFDNSDPFIAGTRV
jgi:phage tail tape-measure protein